MWEWLKKFFKGSELVECDPDVNHRKYYYEVTQELLDLEKDLAGIEACIKTLASCGTLRFSLAPVYYQEALDGLLECQGRLKREIRQLLYKQYSGEFEDEKSNK